MMALAARRAEEDAETKGLLARVDSVQAVNVLCWRYADAPGLLAERIGASPGEKLYTTIGGNTPQWLLNETAEKIAKGEVGTALLAGGEAFNTLRRARAQGVELAWTPPGKATGMVGDRRIGIRDVEMAHGANSAIAMYALYENAIRVAKSHSIDEHQQYLGRLCESLSRVAAENPYAWFREAKTAEQIATVSSANRMVCFPYPKLMNAIMDVDQSAAVIMTSVGRARELGIPESRWVYHLGGAEATDLWFLTERMDYHSSPAIRRAGRRALEAAGLTIDKLDFIDVYSCVPSAVQVGRDMLGISDADPRPLTVTGGLPYAGGPGNNYTMHSIANMAGRLRANPGSTGLVTGMGWFFTKHSVGVYSSAPKDGEWRRPDMSVDQQEIDSAPHPELAEQPEGPGAIETYTVLYDREGQPENAMVIGRLEDGRRFIANVEGDRPVLESMTKAEMVGATGRVRHDEAVGKNLFALS
jgi:acetyl-CoA C-acetyltransferase